MARLNVRDVPDDLHAQLIRAAAEHQRSLEGETRFGLSWYVNSLEKPASQLPTLSEVWQRQTGQRLQQLFKQLEADGFFGNTQPSDLPHLALALGEPSPVLLMDCIEGLEPLSFDLAKRIVERFSCSLPWLLNGTGPMFFYPDIGSCYPEFFEPAVNDSRHTIKMVRFCGGKRDADFLVFRFEENSSRIAGAHGGTQFNLGGLMGGTGQGKFAAFAEYLAARGSLHWEAFNFEADSDNEPLGSHHPAFYLKFSRLNRALWKRPLLEGVAPEKIEWVAP